MQAVTDPATPLEAGGEIFARARKTQSILAPSTGARPVSQATEMFDTDFEDDSEFEEEYSAKSSFETVSLSRAFPEVWHECSRLTISQDKRRSQTTISSYDEAPTPSSGRSHQPFELKIRPVEGPKGPHLFRSSQASVDLSFDFALQMSPVLSKHPPLRTETAFSEDTVTPIVGQREEDLSIATALAQSSDCESADPLEGIRGWTPQQVIDWAYSCNIDASVIECLIVHDVDGQVLLALEFDDLKELDIQSFGKRHQVWNAICDLKGEERKPSPQPTQFEDISRPCTTRRSPSRTRNAYETPVEGNPAPFDGATSKKRRGRKLPKLLDVITPAESISIVAIEQLLPKPHRCAKGERCAKWRKQQRELKQLHDENGIGRFPISPTKGGRIFVHGDPGNAMTAENIIPNVRKQHTPPEPESPFRPTSDVIPSVVASSDLLGPGQLPEFALHAGMLDRVEKRDPQDNVWQFLNFQHMHSPAPPVEEKPPTPPTDLQQPYQDPIARSSSVPALFPEQYYQAYPSLQPPAAMQAPHQNLRNLPRLDISRAATTAPNLNTAYYTATATAVPQSSTSSICRSATASPCAQVYRLGTPASEMDVPVTAFPLGPIERDTSASVPPNMHYRQPLARSHSRAADWRRPSAGLPAVKEGEIFSPVSDPQTTRPRLSSVGNSAQKVRDPAHHSPTTRHFGYGADCTHSGWMKKRKNKMLRHEWHDAHFRLKGTQLGMYENARLSTLAKETINVSNYGVACSSVASSNKLTAAMKAFRISNPDHAKKPDPTAFAFQLVPEVKHGETRKHAANNSKTHHFAVKSKDDRIDWMRELMLAKALQAKESGKGGEISAVRFD